jgi:NADH:ubiquinone oxidoreductase subunit 3 (subunit A)
LIWGCGLEIKNNNSGNLMFSQNRVTFLFHYATLGPMYRTFYPHEVALFAQAVSTSSSSWRKLTTLAALLALIAPSGSQSAGAAQPTG